MAQPDKSKLSESEVSVCKRLTEVRLLIGYEQKAMAEILGLSRDRLASYENFRAPIRYSVGDKLCSVFDLNQRWLATGALPQVGYEYVPKDINAQINERMVFTEAYDTHLKDYILECLKGASCVMGGSPLTPIEELDFHLISNNERKIRTQHIIGQVDPASLLCPVLLSRIRTAFEELPPEERSRFYRHMGRSMIEFRKKLAAAASV